MTDENNIFQNGIESYRSISEDEGAIAALHLLVMATYAFGTEAQGFAISAQADQLGIPHVRRMPPNILEVSTPRNQDELDEHTRRAGGGRLLPEGWHTQTVEAEGIRIALWKEIESQRSVDPLYALLNFELTTSHNELIRVAAAGALSVKYFPQYDRVTEVLHNSSTSENSLVAELALLGLIGKGIIPEDTSPKTEIQLPEEEMPDKELSIAIHGTFARLSPYNQSWHLPSSGLYNLIRQDCTPSMYWGNHYFRWEGGYSKQYRKDAAADLKRWMGKLQAPRLDTVFAHSHGGNVALNALDDGVKIKLLVLMHTPAIPRSKASWSRIQKNVGRVISLQNWLDHIVLMDGLITGSTLSFDQSLLPHRAIKPPLKRLSNVALSHGTFTKEDNWKKWNLADEIKYEHFMA